MKQLIFLILILSHSINATDDTTCLKITLGMLSDYKGENRRLVEYIPAKNLYKYEIKIRNGLMYNHKGDLVTTKGGFLNIFNGSSIFAVSPEGKIYYSDFNREDYFHHSSFLSGKPVAMAGNIAIRKGRIVLIDNSSGHYKPTREMLKQFVKFLKSKNVNTEEIIIYNHPSKNPMNLPPIPENF